MLLSRINGRFKGYWYGEGYIRTSSAIFNIYDEDLFVHLTNDAVQKHGNKYGKFEQGNKISFQEFQRYLNREYFDKKYDFLVQG